MTRSEKIAYALACRLNDLSGVLDKIEEMQVTFPDMRLGQGAHFELDRCERLLKAVRQRDEIRRREVA